MADQKFESWAVVELFGHQMIAGMVTEATLGGCSFIRVDVPAVDRNPAYPRFFGNGAIYSITPCDEEAARVAIHHYGPRPIIAYLITTPQTYPGYPGDEE